MPLITGTIYLFGEILSFALPVGLLLSFATFFYLQGRKEPRNAAPAASASPTATTASAEPPAAPPAPPTRPYSDL